MSMNLTTISWATRTLNLVHGCSKPAAVPLNVMSRYVDYEVHKKWHKHGSSPECIFCYAERLSNQKAQASEKRFGHHKGFTNLLWTPENAYENVQLHWERFKEIGKLPVRHPNLPPSQRERIFICSMGDIFHELVPDDFLRKAWEPLLRYPHIFMLLTKRPERAAQWPGPWPDHIWLGTTCGHSITRWRLNALRASGAAIKFISAEPLLEDIAPHLDLTGIDWVICGGESGPRRRPMEMSWARHLRDLCVSNGVAFFFKQDSAYHDGQRPWLVEEDGRKMKWRQYPGELTPPVEVGPDEEVEERAEQGERELFPILVKP
jgi:protein gp37